MTEDVLLMKVDLQLFAKDGPTGERTEKPTAKKIKDSREEGQVAKSMELNTAVALLVFFILLKVGIGTIGREMLETFPAMINRIPEYADKVSDTVSIHQLFAEVFLLIAKILWPVLLVGVAVAFLSNRLQFSWKVTMKPLKPKFNKINPLSGFKRMFSVQTLMKTLFSVAKIILICVVVYNTVSKKWNLLFTVYDMELKQVIAVSGGIIIDLGIRISALMLIIGFGDFLFQKWKNQQDLMMSKKDIKEEFKNQEGDPQIKQKIRQKQRESSQRRMMESVPKADVIITNPTHYAVALQYDATIQSAPVLLAKGTDYLAEKIKETAKEAGIEIVENRALARLLYHNVEVDAEIPPELYQAVAEVLAYVYKLKHTA